MLEFKKQSPVREGIVNYRISAEHERNKAAPMKKLVRLGVKLRLILFQPEKLRKGVVIPERIAIDRVPARIVKFGPQAR